MDEQDTILTQDVRKTTLYHRDFKSKPDDLGEFTMKIFSWAGPGTPKWTRNTKGRFGLFHASKVQILGDDLAPGDLLPQMRILCHLKANLSNLLPLLKVYKGLDGRQYWAIYFEVVVEIGKTQLQARLQWKEGVSRDLAYIE